MAQNDLPKKNLKHEVPKLFNKALRFFVRWFFMLSLLSATILCVFVWYRYVWKADWNEEKKQQYISEQAKFSFDKAGYQKTTEIMRMRRDRFENFPKFTGKDIFFPD